MKTHAYLGALLVLSLAVCSAAWADFTVTYSSNVISDTVTNWGDDLSTGLPDGSEALAVQKWDPTAFPGMQLTQVSITYTGDVFGNMQFENIDPSNGALLVNAKLSAVQTLYDINGDPIITQTPSVTKGPAVLGKYTGDSPYQYQPPDGVSYNSVTNTLSTVWYNGTSPYLVMFTGSGNIILPTDAQGHDVSDTSGGNIVTNWANLAGASLVVQYSYTPSVPEPAGFWLGALCLLGLGLWRRKR
jgi:hypothetical protein